MKNTLFNVVYYSSFYAYENASPPSSINSKKLLKYRCLFPRNCWNIGVCFGEIQVKCHWITSHDDHCTTNNLFHSTEPKSKLIIACSSLVFLSTSYYYYYYNYLITVISCCCCCCFYMINVLGIGLNIQFRIQWYCSTNNHNTQNQIGLLFSFLFMFFFSVPLFSIELFDVIEEAVWFIDDVFECLFINSFVCIAVVHVQ